MKFDSSLFPPLFNEVRKVRETLNRYCLAGDAIPVPKQNLRVAIQEMYGVRVDVRTVPLNSTLLRGLIERYETHSIIYIDGELNSAWTRYVHAKEICHHLLDGDEFYTADPIATIDYVILDASAIDGDAIPPSKDVQAEILTKFSAIELLFPFEMREICKKEIADSNNSATTYSIAEHFDIPESLVQYAVSDQYMAFANHVWKRV
jgi:hypothetical protein